MIWHNRMKRILMDGLNALAELAPQSSLLLNREFAFPFPTDKETMAMLSEEDREALRHREIDTSHIDASIAKGSYPERHPDDPTGKVVPDEWYRQGDEAGKTLDAKQPPPGWPESLRGP